jgi:hypothetical protein
MRWLFLFVLTLNLAYIGWEMSKSPSEDYADVPALKNVQTIVLLSELKQQAADAAKAEHAEDGAEEALAEVRVAETALAENATAVEADAEKASPEQVDPVATEEKPQEVVKPEPVKAIETKAVEITEKPVVTTAAIQPVTTTRPAQSASCFTLGPFRDLDKLRALTREIKSYVVEADFRGREEREQTLYWVYIKPEKNRASAIETGKRLKAKKVKDFYVIRDGEKVNGLSLGHFRNKNGAYGLAKKVKNLGFDVIVEPVFKIYTVYWLDYQLAGGVEIPESIFDKHVKAAKKDKISRLSRGCGD